MIEAAYFDGKTSRRHEVRLSATREGLDLVGDDWTRHVARSQVRVSEPLRGAPRLLRFGDGGHCEVAADTPVAPLLAALGHDESAVVRWQRNGRLVVLSLLLFAAALGAGYRWGLPHVAEVIAADLPESAVVMLGDQIIDSIDEHMVSPSELPEERQDELSDAFARLVADDETLSEAQLLFRSSPRVGPNAFALPDGRVVLLDELVALADQDEEILGVLAHELGHVHYQHGLRQMIQSSVVAAFAAAYLGDVSSLLSGMSALLLESKYSRDFEFEADAYAVDMMRRNDYSAEGLAVMLEKMERAHDKNAVTTMSSAEWLSTHPDTAERIQRLRAKPPSP